MASKKGNEMFKPFIVYEADKGTAGGSGGNADGEQANREASETLEYESWIKEQPEPVKTLLDGHVRGLKSALDSERESRKDLDKQVRELAGKAEKGSDAEKKLTELANQISEADQRTDFYEDAHRSGVTNLKLAYLVAKQENLFDRKGRVDFEGLKKEYPELFGSKAKAAEGNAGNGTNNGQPASRSMNDFIRAAAGRK